jgi:hypothetical protein
MSSEIVCRKCLLTLTKTKCLGMWRSDYTDTLVRQRDGGYCNLNSATRHFAKVWLPQVCGSNCIQVLRKRVESLITKHSAVYPTLYKHFLWCKNCNIYQCLQSFCMGVKFGR